MEKPLLTPQQIADKFIVPCNPNCSNERRLKGLIREDLVIYIQMAIDAAVKKRETELSTVTNY